MFHYNIPVILLRTCKEELTHPLALMLLHSMSSGYIPKIFKDATVIPIQIPIQFRQSILCRKLKNIGVCGKLRESHKNMYHGTFAMYKHK